eukprot:958980-Ditylum_brightwellii.AAC.1
MSPSINERNVQALADLINATEEDRSMVNNLASVNSTLMTQVANLTRNITEKDTKLTALRKSIKELTAHMKIFNVNSAGFAPGQSSAGRGNTAGQGRQ